MPELPDIVCYIHALEPRILGTTLEKVRLANPFVLRSVDPSVRELEGRKVEEIRRLGKRIAIGVEGDFWLVIHLMIAGRLHWKAKGAKVGGKMALAAFDFTGGTLTLTEASTKKRAGLFTARDESGLEEHRR